jgi:hypothetical protein
MFIALYRFPAEAILPLGLMLRDYSVSDVTRSA